MRWRNLSLHMPELWTNLRIVWPRKKKLVLLLSKWMSRAPSSSPTRSGGLSLSLYEGCDKRNVAPTRAILHLLLDHSRGYRTLELDLNTPVRQLVPRALLEDRGSPDVNPSPFYPPAGLESLKIVLRNFAPIPNGQPGEDSGYFIRFLHASPHLKDAMYDNSIVPLPLDRVCETWKNLRTLKLYLSQPLPELLHALTRCVSLEKLKIYTQSDFAPRDPHTGQVDPVYALDIPHAVLPNLRALELPDFGQIEVLFDSITANSLTSLDIGRMNSFAWRSMTRMLERSDAYLQTLILRKAGLYPSGAERKAEGARLLETLKTKEMAGLSSLKVGFPVGNGLLQMLTLSATNVHSELQDQNNREYLPILTALSLNVHDIKSHSGEGLRLIPVAYTASD